MSLLPTNSSKSGADYNPPILSPLNILTSESSNSSSHFVSHSSYPCLTTLSNNFSNSTNGFPIAFDSNPPLLCPEGINLTLKQPSVSQLHKPTSPNNTHLMQTFVKTGTFKPKALNVPLILPVPSTIRENMQHKEWIKAMGKESDALLRNRTWKFVPHRRMVRSSAVNGCLLLK